MNVMIDLETLSTRANAAILTIGAVQFDEEGLHDEFYARVDLGSCIAAERRIDSSTVNWWMSQSEKARFEAFTCKPRIELIDALLDLGVWIKRDDKVMGNGADFDIAILADAYAYFAESHHASCPWKYYNVRCFRTFKASARQGDLMAAVSSLPPIEGVEHNALYDAKYQAQIAVAILKQGIGI